MNKLVLINQSTGYLTIDTANAYVAKYDEVVLFAGQVGNSERKLDESIKVHRICAYNKNSAIKRMATWAIASIQIFFLLLFKYREYEIVYVTNPPMSYFCSLIFKRPFSIIVYDAYPDALRNIGIKEGHWIYDLWSKWNCKLFSKAHKVYTLSEGMALQLTKYVARERIKVVPLWSGSENFAPIPKNKNPFVKEHKLEDKFIVLYSGNMGYTHNVDTLIDVADILKDNHQIHFLFIGDGKKKSEMVEAVKKKKINNCSFLDWQTTDILPYSLASADIGVVTLNEETVKTSVPSKTFNLMAVGSPLLCIATQDAEIAKIVNKYKNGIVCSSNQVEKIADFILELSNNNSKMKELSHNSLLASKDFTKDNAYLYL